MGVAQGCLRPPQADFVQVKTFANHNKSILGRYRRDQREVPPPLKGEHSRKQCKTRRSYQRKALSMP